MRPCIGVAIRFDDATTPHTMHRRISGETLGKTNTYIRPWTNTEWVDTQYVCIVQCTVSVKYKGGIRELMG
jgi:hypothetical protein